MLYHHKRIKLTHHANLSSTRLSSSSNSLTSRVPTKGSMCSRCKIHLGSPKFFNYNKEQALPQFSSKPRPGMILIHSAPMPPSITQAPSSKPVNRLISKSWQLLRCILSKRRKQIWVTKARPRTSSCKIAWAIQTFQWRQLIKTRPPIITWSNSQIRQTRSINNTKTITLFTSSSNSKQLFKHRARLWPKPRFKTSLKTFNRLNKTKLMVKEICNNKIKCNKIKICHKFSNKPRCNNSSKTRCRRTRGPTTRALTTWALLSWTRTNRV